MAHRISNASFDRKDNVAVRIFFFTMSLINILLHLRGLWNTRGYCFSLDVKNTYDQPLPLLFVLSFTHELCRSCSIISMGRSFRDCLMFKRYILLLFSCYADPVPVVQRELLDQLREPPHARPRESNTHLRYGMNVRRSIGEVVNCGILKSESIIRGVKSKTI